MSRVLLLVEGQTERVIVDRILSPALAVKGIYLYPRIVGKPGYKGGNKFASVRRELKALINQEPDSTVTMLFDYYGLSGDWPGLEEAKSKRHEDVPSIIEPALAQVITDDMGAAFNKDKFIPYIQLHEVETLLFAGPAEMSKVFQKPGLEEKFAQIVHDCGGCEKINDHPDTAPSKRIIKLYPEYKKGSSVNAHAYRIAQRIGLDRIRQQCPHFDEWLTKLELLGADHDN